MGLDLLGAFLRRHRRLALDTNVFIYQLEANERYLSFTERIFTRLERPDRTAVTSTVTMTELLVQPYRDNDQQRVDEIYALLSTYPNLEWVSPNLEIAALAAQLRGQHGCRTPDALQAATAAYIGATGFITNNKVFERVQTFETLVLEKLV